MVCVHKVGSLGVSARLMAVDTIPANVAHEHCAVGVWLGEGATLRCGGVRTHETGVSTASISGLPPVLGMRGQEKYDAMVRKERAALKALARLRRSVTKSAARRLARRRTNHEAATQATAATIVATVLPITALGAHATDFCAEEPEIAPNERDLRALMEALIDSGCFACRTLRNRAALVAPKLHQGIRAVTHRAVPLLVTSGPLLVFGGRAQKVCVARVDEEGVPAFALCAGLGLCEPSSLGLTAPGFRAMQRQAAKLLGVELVGQYAFST